MSLEITWKEVLEAETKKDYYKKLIEQVKAERASGKTVYPERQDVFNAFKLTRPGTIQVVILGQDPYHGPNQAMGLSFSVKKGVTIPPSLRNIFTEVRNSFDENFQPQHGDLTGWAKQGVLLLNTYLTVEAGRPMSHSRIGWERFTDKVIATVDDLMGDKCAFMLWGAYASRKKALIKNGEVFSTTHPSPYSANNGFLGCNHFNEVNEYLIRKGRQGVDWSAL